MTGRPSTPKVIIVHRGQIVVDERVCVDHLYRRRCRYEVVPLGLKRAADGQQYGWPHAFAAAEQAPSHGLMQAPWLSFSRWYEGVEAGFDYSSHIGKKLFNGGHLR
jgi:hypothetical protein